MFQQWICSVFFWQVPPLLWRCWNIRIIKCCYIFLVPLGGEAPGSDPNRWLCSAVCRSWLWTTASELHCGQTLQLHHRPLLPLRQLWPGGGAVTVTAHSGSMAHTFILRMFFFFVCCDDEAVLTRSLPAAAEVLSWTFALLCQLSSKMSLCA